MEGKIPRDLPFRKGEDLRCSPRQKGEVLLPPFVKEGWGGFERTVSSIDNPRTRGKLHAKISSATMSSFDERPGEE